MGAYTVCEPKLTKNNKQTNINISADATEVTKLQKM